MGEDKGGTDGGKNLPMRGDRISNVKTSERAAVRSDIKKMDNRATQVVE